MFHKLIIFITFMSNLLIALTNLIDFHPERFVAALAAAEKMTFLMQDHRLSFLQILHHYFQSSDLLVNSKKKPLLSVRKYSSNYLHRIFIFLNFFIIII